LDPAPLVDVGLDDLANRKMFQLGLAQVVRISGQIGAKNPLPGKGDVQSFQSSGRRTTEAGEEIPKSLGGLGAREEAGTGEC